MDIAYDEIIIIILISLILIYLVLIDYLLLEYQLYKWLFMMIINLFSIILMSDKIDFIVIGWIYILLKIYASILLFYCLVINIMFCIFIYYYVIYL